MRIRYLYILLLLIVPNLTWGQDSIARRAPSFSKQSAIKKLTNSLEYSTSDKVVADDYVTLAKEFYSQNDYIKAENNLQQAVYLYGKSKNKELQAEIYRELARTQEMLLKYDEAIANYTNAAKTTRKKEFRIINQNDAKRLENRNDLKSQSAYLQENIEISNTLMDRVNANVAYQQMAQVKLKMNDTEGAVNQLENALENVQDKPTEALKIKQEIAKVYVVDEQYEKAIGLNESLVAETKKISNPQAEIGQLKNLAHNYFVAKNENKGIQVLEEAYNLAIENHQTMEARNTLRELTNYYKENNDITSALNVYNDFVYKLDTLIKSDSTLIEEKFFQLHEERIKRLENERVLKDELITRTNRFNYVLLGAIILILFFLVLIARALFSISKKNKKIALQSLRREMNPHFIFNSLNSVNQFIAQNNELEANKYLSSYSRLMRNMMENSNKDFITLTTELDQLKEYLELEHMRFQEKFTYEIRVDDSLDTDAIYIPNMLLQPQLENAIWHGLRYKEGNGLLALQIERKEKNIFVTIEDNGIGLKRSRELKTKHQKQHHSRGLNNTNERIQLLNELYHMSIAMDINEKQGEDVSGVIITLRFPLIDKKR